MRILFTSMTSKPEGLLVSNMLRQSPSYKGIIPTWMKAVAFGDSDKRQKTSLNDPIFFDCMAPDMSWFSRSGSMMVLIGLIVESRQLPLRFLNIKNIERLIVYANGSIRGHIWSDSAERVAILAHLTILIGTAVWGYGNLLPGIKCSPFLETTIE